MNALEQAKAKQEKVQREIRQLENRQKILLNKQADAERRARIRRLIEHGAILESIFPALTSLSGEEVKAFLLPLSRLPGVPKLPQEKPPNPLCAPRRGTPALRLSLSTEPIYPHPKGGLTYGDISLYR